MSDDDCVGGPATAQASADNSPSLDSPSIGPELLMEAAKAPGQDLRMTMANSTADPLASQVSEPSTDPDVLLGLPAYKRGRGEIDEPVSADSSNFQDVSELYEGGEQQPNAPNAAKKQKLKQVSVLWVFLTIT